MCFSSDLFLGPYNITHYFQKNLKKYFSTLQNYTLLQTVFVQIFFEPYNVTPYKLLYLKKIQTLQYYKLQTVCFSSDLYLWPYNITHYFQKYLKKYFSTLQNYTLLQTFCFCFFFNLTILHITVKFFWKNIFQHYKITHYFKHFFLQNIF